MELSLKEALLLKQEEVKQTKTWTWSWRWRHCGLACVCLALSCWNAACFVYASRVPWSMFDAASTIHDPETYVYPTKELLYFCLIPVSLFIALYIQGGLMIFILDTKSEKHDMKALYDSKWNKVDVDLYESQCPGTDLYKEVAWDYTEWTLESCAIVYAAALFLQVFFNVFEASRLFSIALIIIFTAAFTFLFGRSFLLNTKIALRIGEKLSNDNIV